MFTPKANSKQKRVKMRMLSQICLTEIGGRFWQFGGRFLSNQNWKISSEIGGRFWQFSGRFRASQQFKNQLNNAFFT